MAERNGMTAVQSFKSKYPGAYDRYSDSELLDAIKKKYPGRYEDLTIKPSIPKQENVLQRVTKSIGAAAQAGMQSMGKAPLGVEVNPQFPFLPKMPMDSSALSAGQAEAHMPITKGNPLGEMGIQLAGGLLSGGLLGAPQKAAQAIGSIRPTLGKTLSKAGSIFKSGSKNVTKRIGDIERMAQNERASIGSLATKDQDALRAQQGFQKENILQKQASMMQQAEDEASALAGGESGSYKNVLSESAERSKRLKSEQAGLKENLSTTAKSEAGEFEPRYAAHLRKMSDNWRSEVDSIAKKNGGIEVDANSIADDLENLLQNERHSILETADDGVTTGGASAVEKTILKLANRLRSKGAVTLDEALQETSAIGKGKKVGAGYSSDDHLLDQVQDLILSKAEGVSSEIAGLRSRWASHAQQRTAAIRKFGLFSKQGKYDPTGRKFIEKRALGETIPEEAQLVSDLEGKVGKIGSGSKDIGSKIRNIDDELTRIDDEISTFSKESPFKVGTKSKEFLDRKKSEITSAIQKELDELNLAIEKEGASIGNKSLKDIEGVDAKLGTSRSRLSDLRMKIDKKQKQLRKAAALTTVGGLVLFRKQLKGLATTVLQSI